MRHLWRAAAAMLSFGTNALLAQSAVSGIVYDSLSGRPLAGAAVQISAPDRTPPFGAAAFSDSLGRFTFEKVPPGRYTVGFFHPLLDSLGIQAPLRSLTVDAHDAARVDLAVPSPATLRNAICRGQSPSLLMGMVRGARDGAPIAGANVSAAWDELSFTAHGIGAVGRHPTATSGANGWFAMCGVPTAGLFMMQATAGADTSDVIDVTMPGGGFLRQDLNFGRSVPSVRITGSVVSAGASHAVAAHAVAGAQVHVVGAGRAVRSDSLGAWTLDGIPAGTHMLEVHALNYFPARVAVDAIDGAPPIHVVMTEQHVALEAVKVTAKMTEVAAGFDDRRRANIGKFFTADDIARRGLVTTTDLFKQVSGLVMLRRADGSEELRMRGQFADWCHPMVYIDGLLWNTLTADEIDAKVDPQDVRGIEIYNGTTVPPQFSLGMAGGSRKLKNNPELEAPCGAIVIWTRFSRP